ncbi:hypothetical protein M404DRAFT_280571 [Pisolithus tinctorius Marx 270]|uniref:Uncharacterized protein n=1 Tax=Pisolithus tinctorius Marx 270 TaxID=870435 RepID=A0A0C3JKK5_PISTI|nr:hypothetical protein M404DRAFT_280571 [Pisolithus tinctorius Marx 270]
MQSLAQGEVEASDLVFLGERASEAAVCLGFPLKQCRYLTSDLSLIQDHIAHVCD